MASGSPRNCLSARLLRSQSTGTGAPKLSVFVRARNERSGVERLWRSLQRQTCVRACEFVFLDDASEDGTREFLLGCDANVYLLPAGTFSFGASCNLGMRLCGAPHVVFLSAHVEVCQAEALELAWRWLADRPGAAAFFRQLANPAVGSSRYERLYLRRRFPPGGRTRQWRQAASFSNAASVIPRRAWEEHAFAEVAASEDYLWAREHLRRRGTIFYFPQWQVLHSHNESPSGITRRVRLNREARGIASSYRLGYWHGARVAAAMLVSGSAVPEAWAYGRAHAEAYWPERGRPQR